MPARRGSGAPADKADAGDELRLDRDDLVQVAGDPRLDRVRVVAGDGVDDEAGPARHWSHSEMVLPEMYPM